MPDHVPLAVALAGGVGPGAAVASRRIGNATRRAVRANEPPSTKGYRDAMTKMGHGMSIPYSGNADQDFVAGMIPHHQGAHRHGAGRAAIRQGPAVAQAGARISSSAQQKEIAFMQAGMARHRGSHTRNDVPDDRTRRRRRSRADRQPPVVILVRPQLADNIGACARAMANGGLFHLRLVAPRDGWPQEKAWRNSSGADRILDAATVHRNGRRRGRRPAPRLRHLPAPAPHRSNRC